MDLRQRRFRVIAGESGGQPVKSHAQVSTKPFFALERFPS